MAHPPIFWSILLRARIAASGDMLLASLKHTTTERRTADYPDHSWRSLRSVGGRVSLPFTCSCVRILHFRAAPDVARPSRAVSLLSLPLSFSFVTRACVSMQELGCSRPCVHKHAHAVSVCTFKCELVLVSQIPWNCGSRCSCTSPGHMLESQRPCLHRSALSRSIASHVVCSRARSG